MPTVHLNPRRRRELRAVLHAGQMSRSQLVGETGLRKNTVLSDVAALMEAGILRETDVAVPTGGRPRTPLEIDPAARHVVGIAIQPGMVQARQVNLLGQALGEPTNEVTAKPAELVPAAARLLRDAMDDRTLAVGVTAPGCLDRVSHRLLASVATPDQTPLSLSSVMALAGDRPVVLENDVNARAARWLAECRVSPHRDTLFVALEDGRVGATLLIDGRPNRGSIGGANELGHSRLPVPTPPCYCGHTGCIERIFSTPYLQQHASQSAPTLPERVCQPDPLANDVDLRQMVDLLACGIANAVNLLRVERLVLATRLPASEPFLVGLAEAVRRATLAEINTRLQVEPHIEPQGQPADAAAQVALVRLFYGGW